MSNTSSCDSKLLFMTLAEINEEMIDISRTLGANRMVRNATSGCDIRMLPDPMQSDEEQAVFESYVEVETQNGQTLWWRLDPSATSTVWKIYRVVGKAGTLGEEVMTRFEEVVFERFSDLRERFSSLVSELADSAKMFNFAP
jgi:hypothetical protein